MEEKIKVEIITDTNQIPDLEKHEYKITPIIRARTKEGSDVEILDESNNIITKKDSIVNKVLRLQSELDELNSILGEIQKIEDLSKVEIPPDPVIGIIPEREDGG
jgi:di/tripeptidase